MLLQTNSYVVPKERRAEHARVIRRFRQALAKIGCDQFEVYEQVGAYWSPAGSNGRYVQIMRFRDRQHQQAVQAAERSDPGAQQIIAEFCDLINFPYQQEHGYFATGFYTSVLPVGPRQAAAELMSQPQYQEELVEEEYAEAAAEEVYEEEGEAPADEAEPSAELEEAIPSTEEEPVAESAEVIPAEEEPIAEAEEPIPAEEAEPVAESEDVALAEEPEPVAEAEEPNVFEETEPLDDEYDAAEVVADELPPAAAEQVAAAEDHDFSSLDGEIPAEEDETLHEELAAETEAAPHALPEAEAHAEESPLEALEPTEEIAGVEEQPPIELTAEEPAAIESLAEEPLHAEHPHEELHHEEHRAEPEASAEPASPENVVADSTSPESIEASPAPAPLELEMPQPESEEMPVIAEVDHSEPVDAGLELTEDDLIFDDEAAPTAEHTPEITAPRAEPVSPETIDLSDFDSPLPDDEELEAQSADTKPLQRAKVSFGDEIHSPHESSDGANRQAEKDADALAFEEFLRSIKEEEAAEHGRR